MKFPPDFTATKSGYVGYANLYMGYNMRRGIVSKS